MKEKEAHKQNDERRKNEEEIFTNYKIDKFLEKWETEEVKEDRAFEPFRFLMNERNVAYDQDLYATSHVNKESEK